VSVDGVIHNNNFKLGFLEEKTKETVKVESDSAVEVDPETTKHASVNNALARGVFNKSFSGVNQLAQNLNQTFDNINKGKKTTESLNQRLEANGLSDIASVSYDFATDAYALSYSTADGKTVEKTDLSEVEVAHLTFDLIGETIGAQLNEKLDAAGLGDSLAVTFYPESNTFSFGSDANLAGRNDLSGNEVAALVDKVIEDFGK